MTRCPFCNTTLVVKKSKKYHRCDEVPRFAGSKTVYNIEEYLNEVREKEATIAELVHDHKEGNL